MVSAPRFTSGQSPYVPTMKLPQHPAAADGGLRCSGSAAARPCWAWSAPGSPPARRRSHRHRTERHRRHQPVRVRSQPDTQPDTPVDTRPRWPLTGKLLKDKSKAQHAAVAVKVPDNRVEHPQRGIDKADIVFVELEGYRDASGYSGTRLVPVFHSRMPDTVEPVRSIRPVDIPLLSPMNAMIGNTGAAPWVVNYVKHYRAHLEGMLSYMNTGGTGSYGTDRSRVYTLQRCQTYYDRATTCHPKMLAKQTKRFRSGPPQLYFPFASTRTRSAPRKGKRGRSVKIPYKGDDYFMGYSYDKKTKRYLRSMPWGPHVLADGTRVSIDNVLVIKAKQHYGKIFRGGAMTSRCTTSSRPRARSTTSTAAAT